MQSTDADARASARVGLTGAETRRAFIERLARTTALPVLVTVLVSTNAPVSAAY